MSAGGLTARPRALALGESARLSENSAGKPKAWSGTGTLILAFPGSKRVRCVETPGPKKDGACLKPINAIIKVTTTATGMYGTGTENTAWTL